MGVVAMVRTLTFTLNEMGRQRQVWNRIISADLPFERNILSFFKISFFFKQSRHPTWELKLTISRTRVTGSTN